MNKIIIIFVILIVTQCQELVIQDWEGFFYTGPTFTKTYQNNDWNNYLDIAIFGWIKINSALTRNQFTTIFHLTSNTDNNFNDYSTLGDRVLAGFTGNNEIQFPTYSTNPQNSNIASPFYFDNQELDKWAFFYTGLDSQNSKQIIHLEFQTLIRQERTSVVHYASQSSIQQYFPGKIHRLMIHAGPNSTRYSNYQVLYGLIPSVTYKCAIAFTEYLYLGNSYNFCKQIKKYDFQYGEIKSIYIPQYGKLTVYNDINYIGGSTTYIKSLEKIDNIPQLIQNQDIFVTP